MYKCHLVLILFIFLMAGCQSSFGPRALEDTHPAYNEAIVDSLNQEMLLNLVRLRYRDTPYFLEVGSVTASLSLDANAALGTEIDVGPGGNVISPGVGIAYSQSPTISYTPLRGEDFFKSVLSPIRLESMLVMIQSGWSIERIFGLCLERINNLENAPSASGPTPETEPRFSEFKRLLYLLRKLQRQGQIEIGADADEDSNNLIIQFKNNSDNQQAVNEVRSLLELSQDKNSFIFSNNFLKSQQEQWNVRIRSISSLMYYLSHNVEVPGSHINNGLVTVTKTRDGTPFDWNQTPAGNLFRIKYSNEKPGNAYIAAPYRGGWYYIADNDLQSKSTFMLLRLLFKLQAGQTKYEGPTLTLPVGGR